MNTYEKQRESLEQIHKLLSIGGKPDTAMCIRYEAAFQIAKEALSEPVRNCDVGSVKEQYHRFCICCTKHKMPCQRSYTFGCAECYAKWSQMPYEKGVAE